LIANAKYGNGNKGMLPELHVIAEGVLKGFVLVNPRWAAFKAEDYQKASQSIADEKDDNQSNAAAIKLSALSQKKRQMPFNGPRQKKAV